jgi:tripartite-type tricarboxylate transporter receptor subunit TctC
MEPVTCTIEQYSPESRYPAEQIPPKDAAPRPVHRRERYFLITYGGCYRDRAPVRGRRKRPGGDMKKSVVALALIALAGIACVQAQAQTQSYPSRQITLIVPFPPGGSTDVAARILAERMRAPLGQPVIIENVGGAGGSIAVGRVARAAPDGYTIDIGQWDTHVGSIIYKLDYDLQKDFEPIGLISNNPQLMVAKKDLPADNLKDLVAWMKANPSKINFVNQNAAANVSGVLFEKLTGQKVHFIPYRGAGPAMTDLVSGQVDLLVVQGAVALPQIRGGKIKAIANLSPQRSASMPDIPTSDEGGVPGLYMSGWFGFFAPKGTPKDVIAKLNSAMIEALADPAVKARFTELGLDVASREQQTPEGLAAFQKLEIDKWWPIIKEAGVTAQ